MRESSEQIEEPNGLSPLHLGSIALHETLPVTLAFSCSRGLEKLLRGRQLRKPDVIEIPRRVFCSGNSAGRTPDGAQSKPFAG
jgi:hypothetical protein